MKSEIIKRLEEQRDALEGKVIKINRIINELKEMDNDDSVEELGTANQGKVRQYKKRKPKSLEVTGSNPKKYKKRKENKWSEEVFEFARKNLNLSNKELAKEINKKFGIKTTEGSLGVQLSKQGISRQKAGVFSKKKSEQSEEKASKKEIEENDKYSRLEKERKAQEKLSKKFPQDIKEFIWNHATKMADELQGMIAQKFGEKMTKEEIIQIRRLRNKEKAPSVELDEEEEEEKPEENKDFVGEAEEEE